MATQTGLPDSQRESSAVASKSATPSVILAHIHDPATFTGTGNVDVDDWLNWYERVSASSRWDPMLMLANAVFYLQGTARMWYDTHEAELTSWDLCKQKLRDLFGQPDGRQRAAKQELASRVQITTESYIAYIQDILALCWKVDDKMSESDKVGHILKGIADNAFNLLVFRNCTIVADVTAECRRFEQAKSRRIQSRFVRLPNTAAATSCEDSLLPRQAP